MHDPLDAFLAETDLDALMAARQRLGPASAGRAARIEGLLRAWQEPQALANLLFHPELIPAPLRLPALLKGLRDRANLYNALAAAVGLQDIDADSVDVPTRAALRGALVELVEGFPTVLAARAAATLTDYLRLDDVGLAWSLLGSPEPGVRHNLLYWLRSALGMPDDAALLQAAAAQGLPAAVLADIEARLAEDRQRLGEGKPARLAHRSYTWIPNLGDI